MSLPDTSLQTLKGLDSKYDSVIKIVDIAEFASRIGGALASLGYSFSIPHVGTVNYDRGLDITKSELDKQKWNNNVFQKGLSFQHQREFRLAFTSLEIINDDFIQINIGNCCDIIKVYK